MSDEQDNFSWICDNDQRLLSSVRQGNMSGVLNACHCNILWAFLVHCLCLWGFPKGGCHGARVLQLTRQVFTWSATITHTILISILHVFLWSVYRPQYVPKDLPEGHKRLTIVGDSILRMPIMKAASERSELDVRRVSRNPFLAWHSISMMAYPCISNFRVLWPIANAAHSY